jgi:predicted nucleic acid-binding protein
MSAETGYQFVDTNIFVYAFDSSTGEKHQQAKILVQKLWNDQSGWVSIQVLQELFVSLTHKVRQPVGSEIAAQIVEDLSKWRVHIPDVKDVNAAIRLHQQHQVSFWDAMILQSAFQAGCDILWSEDLSNGQVFGNLKVANPFKNNL